MGECIGYKIFELALQFCTFKFIRFAYSSIQQRNFLLLCDCYIRNKSVIFSK